MVWETLLGGGVAAEEAETRQLVAVNVWRPQPLRGGKDKDLIRQCTGNKSHKSAP